MLGENQVRRYAEVGHLNCGEKLHRLVGKRNGLNMNSLDIITQTSLVLNIHYRHSSLLSSSPPPRPLPSQRTPYVHPSPPKLPLCFSFALVPEKPPYIHYAQSTYKNPRHKHDDGSLGTDCPPSWSWAPGSTTHPPSWWRWKLFACVLHCHKTRQ